MLPQWITRLGDWLTTRPTTPPASASPAGDPSAPGGAPDPATPDPAAAARTAQTLAHIERGDEHYRAGRMDEAVRAYRAALALDARMPLVQYHLGLALLGDRRPAEAVDAFELAAALDPQRVKLQMALAETAAQLGQSARALRHFRAALALDERLPVAWSRVGKLTLRNGDAEAAAEAYGRWHALEPGSALAASNHLYCLAYASSTDSATRARRYLDWGRAAVSAAPPCTLDLAAWARQAVTLGQPAPGGRPVRIGYLSPDLREHSLRFFFAPVLRGHDRQRFALTVYHDHPKIDAVHEAMRGPSEAQGDRWVDVAGQTDDALAQRITDDGIDVLVELAGHTRGNRLAMLARRVAPAQISALGYPPTTGLAVMDGKLSDPLADPHGADAWYSEHLMRLPGGFWCFEPPADAPPVASAPCATRRHITFGFYGEAAKLSDDTLAAWAALLRALPQARLHLKVALAARQDHRVAFVQRLADAGVPVDRVQLRGASTPLAAYLAEYADIDIVLDSWPFNGGTTTCLALWMGVPVLTRAGDCLSSRMGTAMLTRLGLHDWVATDNADFAARGVRLASDRAALQALRASLRDRLAASALLDARAWTAGYEQACLELIAQRARQIVNA